VVPSTGGVSPGFVVGVAPGVVTSGTMSSGWRVPELQAPDMQVCLTILK